MNRDIVPKISILHVLWQERMKHIIGQSNLYDLVMKKILRERHFLRSLGGLQALSAF